MGTLQCPWGGPGPRPGGVPFCTVPSVAVVRARPMPSGAAHATGRRPPGEGLCFSRARAAQEVWEQMWAAEGRQCETLSLEIPPTRSRRVQNLQSLSSRARGPSAGSIQTGDLGSSSIGSGASCPVRDPAQSRGWASSSREHNCGICRHRAVLLTLVPCLLSISGLT